MADLAQGTWTLESSENFDEYMKEVGVGMVMRKMAGAIKPNTEISVEGNKWTIKTLSTLKSTEINFTLDEEFDETTADGRKVKTTASLNGNTLTAIQKGSPDSTLTREFSEDTMKLILTAGDVKCTRIYKRVTK